MTDEYQNYYVPEQSYWPIIGSIGLFIMVIGVINVLHADRYGWLVFLVGSFTTVFMMFGWFSNVIKESRLGLYNAQLDRSFRLGMVWFIFSEVMFFAAFFGALFYARNFSVPWMGGIGAKTTTHLLLWDNFTAIWPLLKNPNPTKFIGPLKAMGAWGIPTLNTLILLTSGATITLAHLALKNNHRKKLILGLIATITLAIIFLLFQAYEYYHAYTDLGLKLNSGIYGTTFFMLTGFHGAHVTVGTIMLIVILMRCMRGHFTPEKHFGFEATAWYWHFVDVIWLMLFILVYWL
jgi:cytochrome c oxidase subunit III